MVLNARTSLLGVVLVCGWPEACFGGVGEGSPILQRHEKSFFFCPLYVYIYRHAPIWHM